MNTQSNVQAGGLSARARLEQARAELLEDLGGQLAVELATDLYERTGFVPLALTVVVSDGGTELVLKDATDADGAEIAGSSIEYAGGLLTEVAAAGFNEFDAPSSHEFCDFAGDGTYDLAVTDPADVSPEGLSAPTCTNCHGSVIRIGQTWVHIDKGDYIGSDGVEEAARCGEPYAPEVDADGNTLVATLPAGGDTPDADDEDAPEPGYYVLGGADRYGPYPTVAMLAADLGLTDYPAGAQVAYFDAAEGAFGSIPSLNPDDLPLNADAVDGLADIDAWEDGHGFGPFDTGLIDGRSGYVSGDGRIVGNIDSVVGGGYLGVVMVDGDQVGSVPQAPSRDQAARDLHAVLTGRYSWHEVWGGDEREPWQADAVYVANDIKPGRCVSCNADISEYAPGETLCGECEDEQDTPNLDRVEQTCTAGVMLTSWSLARPDVKELQGEILEVGGCAREPDGALLLTVLRDGEPSDASLEERTVVWVDERTFEWVSPHNGPIARYQLPRDRDRLPCGCDVGHWTEMADHEAGCDVRGIGPAGARRRSVRAFAALAGITRRQAATVVDGERFDVVADKMPLLVARELWWVYATDALPGAGLTSWTIERLCDGVTATDAQVWDGGWSARIVDADGHTHDLEGGRDGLPHADADPYTVADVVRRHLDPEDS